MNDSKILELALERLPHGSEFRFIDRLIKLEPGRSGVGEYRVKGDESFLKGHFIDNPIVPGVILIEAVAQLAGVVAQSDPHESPLDDLKLTTVKNGKIMGSARPGEILLIKAEISKRFGELILASGKVFTEGNLILTTEIVLGGEWAKKRGAVNSSSQ